MERTDNIAVLFDFDGVIMDTEKQYSTFWNKVGRNYLGLTDLEVLVKGQTLTYIYQKFFPKKIREQDEITIALNRFEETMDYEYVPGVLDFVNELHKQGIQTAVVTSSNVRKMESVYKIHPQLPALFDHILTAEAFEHSKPAPDCFIAGMKVCESIPETTYVFEDSINGLKAGLASGATVVGMTTTNPCNVVEPLCHYVLNDFTGFTLAQMLQIRKTTSK